MPFKQQQINVYTLQISAMIRDQTRQNTPIHTIAIL